ncbi:hypothetical protein K492DRAFT_138700 [Lichtheimia hyalospora FSU 10163]|nr:hypothetical protein K492DRAFT_138700 [Lichtheimia hyalospora FSU 10163]
MTSGQKAGLLKSDELKYEAMKAKAAEQRMIEKLKEGDSGRYADTVRRDETGRIIDPKIKKAKEAQARRDAIEKEEQRMEWGKGLVQRSEEQKKSQQLAEEKDKPLARYVDDVEYNRGLKDTQRWNDPAAGFLTNRSRSTTTNMVRPTYKGAWKPNRYMIPPGYRWDGVDRSNGFEDQFLLNLNQKQARKVEAHAWSTEDM